MKGSLAISLRGMVEERFDRETWRRILDDANVPAHTLFMTVGDIDDRMYFDLVQATCRVLNWTQQEAWEQIGDYWVRVYTQKVYSRHYDSSKDARSFLLHMDSVHRVVTQATPNAEPPRFEFEEPDEHSLLVRYISRRDMFVYFRALVRAVARHYGEDVDIREIAADRLRLTFSRAGAKSRPAMGRASVVVA